jgi:hypothetical protein
LQGLKRNTKNLGLDNRHPNPVAPEYESTILPHCAVDERMPKEKHKNTAVYAVEPVGSVFNVQG